jgi:hypothetical protein
LRESIWGYAVVVLGIMAIGVIWFFASATRTDQHNYNLLKETTESAMFDARDLASYREDGSIRIAVGTLQPQAVEANTLGTGLPKRFYGMFAYLDLEKMDWRGFKEERFIGTIEN